MTEATPGENAMTVKELAAAAGVSEQRIRQILSAGDDIRGAYKFGYTWVIPRAAAERWLEQRKEA